MDRSAPTLAPADPLARDYTQSPMWTGAHEASSIHRKKIKALFIEA